MVWIPGISRLEKRKGGGRGGGGTSSGGSKGGTSSSGSSSSGSKGGTSSGTTSSGGGTTSSSGGTSRPAFSVPNTATGTKGASTYGSGGGRVSTIPAGTAFAGRQQGGATRDQVYGSNVYGSGYPAGYSATGRGVGGAGFPFYFWPLAWGGGLGYGAAYLHNREYGDPNNSSRPGGPMMQFSITSPAPIATYHVVSDNNTVHALIDTLTTNCSTISNKPLTAKSFSGGAGDPQPETTIQYYRSSSVALTLDGYNNTAALSDDTSLPNTPLPSSLDQTFLNCLNVTIGASVPLIDGACPSVGGAPLWLLVATLLVAVRNAL
ncbi:hypothetical protein EXIGLDRAFT_728659 [Exidia glandulosa HHB12029]|uniref:Uncharacterized protein n=1 Tax=Exidia glandulosa HHB12029 TaxID=1314781 RepID=A0A165LQU7_EXIGL|nr:hypothetical protein EXIGLDRAFT_728659 [Exidia glandulosa HHB12029]